MKPYFLHSKHDDLVDLLPLLENTDYVVEKGNPIASIRLDTGTATSKHRSGIWRCTPGTFSCVEKGDELQTILSGKLRLTEKNGSTSEFLPGDSVVTTKGSTVTWEIIETVEKVFFTHDPDGN